MGSWRWAGVGFAAVVGCVPAFGGPAWRAVPGGPTGEVRTLLAMDGGAQPRLYAAGVFAGLEGGVSSPNIASWTGSGWLADTGLATSRSIAKLESFPMGGRERVVAGGLFAFGSPFDGLAVLMDGVWTATPPGPQNWVNGLGVRRVGGSAELFVSGAFLWSGGGYVARFDGSSWLGAPPGIISVSESFAEFDDGGGTRFYAGWPPEGTSVTFKMSRWDGTSWAAFGTDAQVRIRPRAFVVHDDGTGEALYLGGSQEAASGPRGVARYRGGVFSALGAGVVGEVHAMAVFDDGGGPGLVVAGALTSAGGAPVSRIAMWRDGAWHALGSGLADGRVNALAVFDDDGPGPARPALYAGGTFTAAGGVAAPFIARWGYCAADWNLDGVIDFNDLLEFLNDYNASLPKADVNADGVVDFNDLLEYLNLYNAAC